MIDLIVNDIVIKKSITEMAKSLFDLINIMNSKSSYLEVIEMLKSAKRSADRNGMEDKSNVIFNIQKLIKNRDD